MYVEESNYERENIINGWHFHFSNLAVRQRMQYMTTNIWIFANYDYHSIQRIIQHYSTKTVEMETILEAVQSLNKGKAEDMFGISI